MGWGASVYGRSFRHTQRPNAEKQILGFKLAPPLEQVGDEHSEQVQDRKHRLSATKLPVLDK
jgi:hypothetical protein